MRLYREALFYLRADIHKYILMSDAEMPVNLIRFVVQVERD